MFATGTADRKFCIFEENRHCARNAAHPTSENGKLAALTSGHRAFRRHVEHAESGDTPPCLAHAESTERRAKKSSTAKLQTRQRSPAGLRRRRKRTHAIRRASAFSGCSFGGDFTSSSRPCCGRGREGPCFAVWAAVCDPSPKAECVPAFTRESERGPFVREIEERDEKRFEIEPVTVTFWRDSWK